MDNGDGGENRGWWEGDTGTSDVKDVRSYGLMSSRWPMPGGFQKPLEEDKGCPGGK